MPDRKSDAEADNRVSDAGADNRVSDATDAKAYTTDADADDDISDTTAVLDPGAHCFPRSR